MTSEYDMGPDENETIDAEITKVMHSYIPYIKIALLWVLVTDSLVYILYYFTDVTDLNDTERSSGLLYLIYIVFFYTLFCLVLICVSKDMVSYILPGYA